MISTFSMDECPPRPHQLKAASFLSTQGMWNVACYYAENNKICFDILLLFYQLKR